MKRRALVLLLCGITMLTACASGTNSAPNKPAIDIYTTTESPFTDVPFEQPEPENSLDKEIIKVGAEPGTVDDLISPAVTPDATEAPSTDAPNSGENPGGDVEGDGTFVAADATITYAGVALKVGEVFDDNIDKLGTPEITQGQACLDGGYDTNYYYGKDIAVYTVSKDNKHVIYTIYVTKKGFTTKKGATIGTTTKEEIRTIYGQPTNSLPSADKYNAGNGIIASFNYANGILESIDIIDGNING